MGKRLHGYCNTKFERRKITKNNFRHNAEAVYKTRFFQLSGNQTENIAFIEGRFSPQKTEKENVERWFNLAKKQYPEAFKPETVAES